MFLGLSPAGARVLLPQRGWGWQERQGAQCPGWAQIRSLLKEAPAQRLLIKRSPGRNEPAGKCMAPAKRQRSYTKGCCEQALNHALWFMENDMWGRTKAWGLGQPPVAAFTCLLLQRLLDLLIRGSSGGIRNTHNAPKKDTNFRKL